MTRFTDAIGTFLLSGTGAILKATAAEQHTTVSAYVRLAVMEKLTRDGADISTAPDAGTLYDVVPEGRQWALVEGGQVLSYGAAYRNSPPPVDRPTQRWLPVVYEDSEPFDPAKHWRVPHAQGDVVIRDDVVVRTFVIVPKEAAHA